MERRSRFGGRTAALAVTIVLAIACLLFGLGFLDAGAVRESRAAGADGGQPWMSYSGQTDITFQGGAMQVTSASNPGTVAFTGGKFSDYEMEAEIELVSGPWFGIMYRTKDAWKGLYQIGAGSTPYRQLKRHQTKYSGNGWDETHIDTAAAGYTAYALGKKVWVKWTVEDNAITLQTKVEGDEEYFTEFDKQAIDVETLGTGAGYVGFCFQHATAKIYNVKITDKNSAYTYTSDFGGEEDVAPVWEIIRGASPVTQSDGKTMLSPTANPTVYAITNIDFTDYVLETEYSYNAQWAGVVYRVNGIQKGLYMTKTTKNHFSIHETNSGNGWGTDVDAPNSDYTKYTLGKHIRLRLTMQDNKITVESMIVGTDHEYHKDAENYDFSTDYGDKLGTHGGVGLVTRTGATQTVYSFKVTDTVTGKTYTLPALGDGEWGSMYGSATAADSEDAGTHEATKEIGAEGAAAYGLKNVNFNDYVLETELKADKGTAGIVFRGYDGQKGVYTLTPAGRAVDTFTEGSLGGSAQNASGDGLTAYAYGDRIKLRLTVKDNKLTVESQIPGKEETYHKDFDALDISTLGAGALGDNGEVGLYLDGGATLTVYSFTVTDGASGRRFGIAEAAEEPLGEGVVFDGNTATDARMLLSQTPDTLELWFKTSVMQHQTIISDYTEPKVTRNGFYLDMLDDGTLSYFEANAASSASDVSNLTVTTAKSYADGQWHKVVIRRAYEQGAGLFGVRLSVFTGETLEEQYGSSYAIAAEKKAFYEESGDRFLSQSYLQLGAFRQLRYLFEGEIAEIRMWDYALGDEEIAAARTALTGREKGLLYDLVADGTDRFADKVSGDGPSPFVTDTYKVWMDDYVLPSADFRIAVLPDVQFINENFELNLREYFTWIRDNAERLNIRLVLTVGDLVNTCTPEQYATISEAASILDGTVPFMPTTGNHDYPSYGRDELLFKEYYPYEKYAASQWWGGAYEEGSLENYYYLTNFNGQKIMFLALEVAVRPAVAAWANEAISAHPDYKAIIINHAYLDPKDDSIMDEDNPYAPGAYKTDDGMSAAELWESVISKHSNIVMVICGHMDTHRVSHLSSEGEGGHRVETVLFDASMVERSNGGVSLTGILGFHDGSNTVNVNFYSIEKDMYFCGRNQFEVELDWQEEYRVRFEARGEIVWESAMKAGESISAPEAPANYSDGTHDYVFESWEGYSDGLTATQNYVFRAVFTESEAAGPRARSGEELAAGIAHAKDLLFSGRADAYVTVATAADGVDAVETDVRYENGQTLRVFGREMPVFTVFGGTLAVHVLALYPASGLIAFKGEGMTFLSLPAVAERAETEVILPRDLGHSRYDYFTGMWNVSVRGDDEIGLQTATEIGGKVVIGEGGENVLADVTKVLGRRIALHGVAGENGEVELVLFERDRISHVTVRISLLQDPAADGDLGDWSETVLSTGRTMRGLGVTAHKSVTFYAQLTEKGLYVAARAEHDRYVNSAADWSDNTNFEFYVNNTSLRYWICADPAKTHEDVTGTIVTGANLEGTSRFLSVAEGFIPIEKLPVNARTGELNIGFAWKTPQDTIEYYNMTAGDWWYPTRRHASMIAEQYFVNSFGICDYSSVRTANGIVLDGDFSDFNAEAQVHDLAVYGEDGDAAIGYTVKAQYVLGSGIYLGLHATHRTNPRPVDNLTWSNNTNFEFYIGANRYYITGAGAAVGNGLFGKNTYLAQTYDEGTSLWTTVIECFLPDSALGTASQTDYVRIGFAFKPTGEMAEIGGRVQSDWWYPEGHTPSDIATQFYIYACGISTTEAVALNSPETCLDVQLYRLTAPSGESYTASVLPDTLDASHSYGAFVTVREATCTGNGEGYVECELCHSRVYSTIPATGEHSYGEWVQIKAPTCTEAGEERRYCATCREYETHAVAATGHGEGMWVVAVRPTEEAEGREDLVCEHCGEVLDSRAVPQVQQEETFDWAVLAGCLSVAAAVVGVGVAVLVVFLRRRKLG